MPKINVKRMKVRKKNNEWEAVPGFGEGVYPVDKTAAMTQPVGRDAQGRLFTAPTGGGGGGTVDVDPTLTQEGMAADAKAVGDAIGDKITAPTSGSVGDVLTVSAVDGEGKPVAVKTQKGVLTDDQELTEQEKSFARRNIGALKNNVYLNWDDAIRELVDGDGDDTLCFVQSDNTVTSGDAQLKLPAMILVYQGSWDYKPFTVYDSNGETFKGVLGAAVTGDDGRRWFFEKATAGQPLAIKLISDTDDNGNVTYSVDKTAAELENAVKNRTMCYLYSGDRIYQFQDTHTSPNGDINIGFSSTAEQSRLFDAEFVNIFVSQSGTKVSVYVFTEPLLLGATFFIQESLDGDLLGGTTNNAFADAVCLRQSIDYIHWELPTTGAISANIKTLDEDENPIATKLLTDGKMTTDGENFVVTFDDLKDGVRYTVTGNLNDGEDEERLIFSTVTKEDIGAADDTKVEHIANKVTELSAESTDTQYPSAKAVYTKFSEIDAALGSYITDVAELIGGDA